MVKLAGEQFRIKSARADAQPLDVSAFVSCPALRSPLACCRLPLPASRGPPRATPSPCTARRRCRPISPICPTPIPTPPRAAGWSGAARNLRQPQSADRRGARRAADPGLRSKWLVLESLMARGNDEAFTLYGLLAKTVETDDARSYVTFRLDPRARFSDGKPVHGRRRAVFLGAAARQGAPQPSPVLRQGRQGRSARPAHGAVRSSPAPTTASCR